MFTRNFRDTIYVAKPISEYWNREWLVWVLLAKKSFEDKLTINSVVVFFKQKSNIVFLGNCLHSCAVTKGHGMWRKLLSSSFRQFLSRECVPGLTECIKRMAPFVGNFISHSLRWGIHHRFLSRLPYHGYFETNMPTKRVEFSIGTSLIIYVSSA